MDFPIFTSFSIFVLYLYNVHIIQFIAYIIFCFSFVGTKCESRSAPDNCECGHWTDTLHQSICVVSNICGNVGVCLVLSGLTFASHFMLIQKQRLCFIMWHYGDITCTSCHCLTLCPNLFRKLWQHNCFPCWSLFFCRIFQPKIEQIPVQLFVTIMRTDNATRHSARCISVAPKK